MKVNVYSFSENHYSYDDSNELPNANNVQIVLCFGAKHKVIDPKIYPSIAARYPNAAIALCSTSGEIVNNAVLDDTISITAIEFEKTTVETASVNIEDYGGNSFEAGIALIEQLKRDESLKYIMVLSDGSLVNGSDLVSGINSLIKNQVPVTGGLAGDGDAFISTAVGLNECPVSGKIIAIGFYGNHLVVSHGTMGGWETFGPERTITRSKSNQLFEINHENALDLYKKYLGNYAEQLPGSALLFPLSVQLNPTSKPLVRTILAIDNDEKSMTFAGNVPEGAKVRFMRANLDKIINAANDAALNTFQFQPLSTHKLALLVSCVGRKIILGNRLDEEVEAVFDAFQGKTQITGFYSYGEISPFSAVEVCELHNQTMTITTFDEN